MAYKQEWELATRDTVDQGRAYQAYCLLGGNCAKVAAVMHCSEEVVASLAHDFEWGKNIRADISSEDKLEAFRKVNRMSQYAIAERMREIIGRMTEKMFSDPDFATRMWTKSVPDPDDPDKNVVTFEPKNMEALVKMMGMLGEISYRALGDKEAAKHREGAAAVVDPLGLYEKLANRFADTAIVNTAKAIKDVGPLRQQ